MGKKIIILSFFLLFVFNITVVHASYNCLCSDGTKKTVEDCNSCYNYCVDKNGQASCTSISTDTSNTVSLTNPLGDKQTDIPVLIGKVINAVLGIVGSLALVMFIYGGITWMTSAGNAEKVQKGKDTLVWAAIGLVIIFASYALVRFVIQDAILGTAI